MVDFHVGKYTMFFEDPVDLLFFAPDDIPIIIPTLFPFAILEGIIDAIFEGGFKPDVATE